MNELVITKLELDTDTDANGLEYFLLQSLATPQNVVQDNMVVTVKKDVMSKIVCGI